MSTLLLIGGPGPMRVGQDMAARLVGQARARGMRTHLTIPPDEAPLGDDIRSLVDAVSEVGFADIDACVTWARRRVAVGERLAAVFGLREYAQVAVAEVAAQLGLPGNPPNAVRRVRSKDACRAALAAAGFPQPAFRLCADAAEAGDFIRASRGPWVVKPRDAMGSLGVSKISGLEGLGAAVAALPDSAPFLVEEFVEGREFSVEGVFRSGLPHVLAITQKEVTRPPFFVEVGHVLPAQLSPRCREEVDRHVTSALSVLGLRFGVFHVEIWLTHRGVVLGEVHVRPGGDWIHAMLAHAAPGLELFGGVMDDALGRQAQPLPRSLTRGAAVRFLLPPAGALLAVDGWDRVLKHPAVLHADLTVEPGAVVRPVRDSADRAGVIVVGADTSNEAQRLAVRLANSVRFTVDPHPSSSDTSWRSGSPVRGACSPGDRFASASWQDDGRDA